jgi:hypothetical protein
MSVASVFILLLETEFCTTIKQKVSFREPERQKERNMMFKLNFILPGNGP